MIKNRYYSHIRRKGLLNDLADEAEEKEEYFVKCEEESNSAYETQEYSENVSQSGNVSSTEIRKVEHEDVDYFLSDKDRDVKFFDLTDPFFELNSYFLEDELHTRITPYKSNFLFDY